MKNNQKNKRILFKVASAFFVLLVLLVGYKGYGYYKLMDPDPLTYWDASNESNTSKISHLKWQQILSKYVHPSPELGINLFDYGGVSDEDYELLDTYLNEMAALDPRAYAKDEQKAYWINLYNAITIKVILDEYPVESIKETGEGLVGSGPWDDKLIAINGVELSLNNIEHGILRRIWSDNRIHYGVNCASVGCPDLSAQAYTSDTLDAHLAESAKGFINNPRGVNFTEDKLILSSIFNWFVSDFGGSEENLLTDLQKHATPDLAKRLSTYKGSIKYDYDWRLNDTSLLLPESEGDE
ncbi:DUF547 domain-containing protein [Agaribacter flavus]|uniref:DUF547 domain-containing protein n=1 Tax=Agaribacter flavus TaxID=1902781 RepID=A0ABV7FNL5_9ALTE